MQAEFKHRMSSRVTNQTGCYSLTGLMACLVQLESINIHPLPVGMGLVSFAASQVRNHAPL